MARSVRPPVPVHAHLRTHRRERREIREEPQGGQAGSSRREQVRADPGRHPSAAAMRRDATKLADTAPTSASPIWLALAIAEHRLTAGRHEENEHQPTTTTNIPNDNEYSKQQRTFQTTTNTNNDRRLLSNDDTDRQRTYNPQTPANTSQTSVRLRYATVDVSSSGASR